MENDFKKGINDLRKLGPTSTEKDLMLSRISEATGIKEAEFKGKIPTYNELRWSFLFHGVPLASLLVLVLVFGSGAFIVKSKGSIPGDVLYPIKTVVEEPLVGAVSSFSEVSKIQWEADKADRRLSEVEELTEKGKISTSTIDKAEEGFVKSAKAVDSMIQSKKTTDDSKTQEKKAEVRNNFEKKVEEHNKKLNTLKKNLPSDIKKKVDNFQKSVMKNLRTEDKQKDSDDKSNEKTATTTPEVKNKEATTTSTTKDSGFGTTTKSN
jgi:hypothetical protein